MTMEKYDRIEEFYDSYLYGQETQEILHDMEEFLTGGYKTDDGYEAHIEIRAKRAGYDDVEEYVADAIELGYQKLPETLDELYGEMSTSQMHNMMLSFKDGSYIDEETGQPNAFVAALMKHYNHTDVEEFKNGSLLAMEENMPKTLEEYFAKADNRELSDISMFDKDSYLNTLPFYEPNSHNPTDWTKDMMERYGYTDVEEFVKDATEKAKAAYDERGESYDRMDKIEEFYTEMYGENAKLEMFKDMEMYLRGDHLDRNSDWLEVRAANAGYDNVDDYVADAMRLFHQKMPETLQEMYKEMPAEQLHKLMLSFKDGSYIDEETGKPNAFVADLMKHYGYTDAEEFIKDSLPAMEEAMPKTLDEYLKRCSNKELAMIYMAQIDMEDNGNAQGTIFYGDGANSDKPSEWAKDLMERYGYTSIDDFMKDTMEKSEAISDEREKDRDERRDSNLEEYYREMDNTEMTARMTELESKNYINPETGMPEEWMLKLMQHYGYHNVDEFATASVEMMKRIENERTPQEAKDKAEMKGKMQDEQGRASDLADKRSESIKNQAKIKETPAPQKETAQHKMPPKGRDNSYG